MTISHTDWENLALKFLRGMALDTLCSTTADGLTRGPLSDRDSRPENIAPLARGNAPLRDRRPWHICTPVRDPDINFSNTQLLDDLKGGASALRITIGESGVKAEKPSDIRRLLTGVLTDIAPICLAPSNMIAHAELFKDFAGAHLYLGLGPKTEGLDGLIPDLPENWRAITINAARVAESGGTPVQELAYLAASAAYAYRCFGPEVAARHINAELTTDQDAHLNMAKLRAARRIYGTIAKSFGKEDAALSIHAITARHMMQSQDAWTNMLRVMSAGIGAVIGGADFVTLRPFTDGLGAATPAGYRLARNMQILMMEESHLGQVQDPAFGSYFHEEMTEKLARAAWAEFQQIESEGGIDNIAPFKARIQAGVEKRTAKPEPILGVTLHPFDGRKPEIRG